MGSPGLSLPVFVIFELIWHAIKMETISEASTQTLSFVCRVNKFDSIQKRVIWTFLLNKNCHWLVFTFLSLSLGWMDACLGTLGAVYNLQHFLVKFPVFVFVLDLSNIVNNLVDRYVWKDLVMFSRCKYKCAVYQQGLWALNSTGRFIKAKNESKSEA